MGRTFNHIITMVATGVTGAISDRPLINMLVGYVGCKETITPGTPVITRVVIGDPYHGYNLFTKLGITIVITMVVTGKTMVLYFTNVG